MKNIKLLAILFLSAVVTISCNNDDDDTPEIVNDEEVITTMTVTLTPDGGGTPIVLQTRDLDGDGPNAPVITISDDLAVNSAYNGKIVLLNETVSPPEDITEEVEEEAEEHQFFYTVSSDLLVGAKYTNFDANDNPLGTEFILEVGAASTGTITFTLRHEPTKPNTGLSSAGGETDIEASFTVTIQ